MVMTKRPQTSIATAPTRTTAAGCMSCHARLMAVRRSLRRTVRSARNTKECSLVCASSVQTTGEADGAGEWQSKQSVPKSVRKSGMEARDHVQVQDLRKGVRRRGMFLALVRRDSDRRLPGVRRQGNEGSVPGLRRSALSMQGEADLASEESGCVADHQIRERRVGYVTIF